MLGWDGLLILNCPLNSESKDLTANVSAVKCDLSPLNEASICNGIFGKERFASQPNRCKFGRSICISRPVPEKFSPN